MDLSHTTKELYGEKQFPVDVARGQGKISIKAKAARIDAKLFNDIYFQGNFVQTGSTSKITVMNQMMGNFPWFSLELETTFQGKTMILFFPKCNSGKLAMNFKNDDYTIPDFDINVAADENDVVYTATFRE